MFDIAWTELLVIAVVAILVVGPRELPKMLRGLGTFMGQMRRMAGDFQRQFNDALREAELDDIKRGFESVKKANPASQLREQLNPLKKAGDDLKKAVEDPGAPRKASDEGVDRANAAPATPPAKSTGSTGRSTGSPAKSSASGRKPSAKTSSPAGKKAAPATRKAPAKKPAAASKPKARPAKSRPAAKPAARPKSGAPE